MANPTMGWRARYGGRGTEEFVEAELDVDADAGTRSASPAADGRARVPDATGLELIAQELRERARRRRGRRHALLPRQGGAEVAPARGARGARAPARARASASWPSLHGVDYFPEEPRLGVHYELLDMDEVDRITVKAARADSTRPNVAVGDAATGRPPTTRSARSTTCSAWSSTATPTCAGS